jgi:hypothetical protein
MFTWGLRPRLYAATCFAGSGHNMLALSASQVPGTTCLRYLLRRFRTQHACVICFAGSGHNMLALSASQVPGITCLRYLLRRFRTQHACVICFAGSGQHALRYTLRRLHDMKTNVNCLLRARPILEACLVGRCRAGRRCVRWCRCARLPFDDRR